MKENEENTILDFLDYRGLLVVKLDRARFERVLKMLQDESSIQELSEVDLREVWEIVVKDASRVEQTTPVESGFKDRLFLLGCGLIAFVVLFGCLIGLLAISGFVPLPK